MKSITFFGISFLYWKKAVLKKKEIWIQLCAPAGSVQRMNRGSVAAMGRRSFTFCGSLPTATS